MGGGGTGGGRGGTGGGFNNPQGAFNGQNQMNPMGNQQRQMPGGPLRHLKLNMKCKLNIQANSSRINRMVECSNNQAVEWDNN